MAERVKLQFRGAAVREESSASGDRGGQRDDIGFSNGDRAGVRMDVETEKSYFTHATDSAFFACGSVLHAQRNPRIRETGGRSLYFVWSMDRPGSHPSGYDD